MSHTYVSGLFHCVFSTKGRCGLIPPAKQPDLWSYLGGIARKNGFKAVAVGGTDNHVHLLLSLPATMTLAKAMQLLKGGSSKWMNDSGANAFAWQEGYGAFSVGISQQAGTISYIRSQAEHHHKLGFEEQFLAFLNKHGSTTTPAKFGADFSRPSGTCLFLLTFPGAELPGCCQSPLAGLRMRKIILRGSVSP